MIPRILGSLSPIILVALIGFVLARRGRISTDTRQGLNYLAYWIGLPSLLFLRSLEADLSRTESLPMTGALLAGMLAALAGGGWLTRRYGGAQRGVVLQAAFRGNLIFIGLPVLVYAMDGVPAPIRDRVVSDILLAAAPVILLYNVAAVLVLSLNDRSAGRHVGGTLWRMLLTNPLILAVAAGLVCNRFGVRLPRPLLRTLGVMESLALPLALLGVGAQLAQVRTPVFSRPVLAASALKLVLCPLAGGLVAWGMGLPPDSLRAVLIFLAAPTAVSSYVLADQLGADRDLAAGCVVGSTLLSLVTFSLVLLI